MLTNSRNQAFVIGLLLGYIAYWLYCRQKGMA